jgi:hypothetical protein
MGWRKAGFSLASKVRYTQFDMGPEAGAHVSEAVGRGGTERVANTMEGMYG